MKFFPSKIWLFHNHSVTVCAHSRCGQLLPGFDDRAAVKLTVVSTFACELLQFALCNGDMGGPMRDR